MIDSIEQGSFAASDRVSVRSESNLWANSYVHTAFLLLLLLCTFARTLTSYFLADDFCEIAYVQEIFHGHPEMFWSNFTGNYMQIPGMNVYRPWLLCSLVFDWLLYGAKAWGFYLTNLLYLFACVVAYYAAVKVLTKSFGSVRSSLCALCAATAFLVSPLHCESISWVVGRVDIITAFFYLVGLALFSQNILAKDDKNYPRTIWGVIAFVFALCTKEMAVGLPVMVFAISFLWQRENLGLSFLSVKRWRNAFIQSAPLWAVLLFYFVARMLFLKTAVGGYVAGFGAGQLADLMGRWLDRDTLTRLLVPLHHDIYDANPGYRGIVWAVLTVVTTLAAVRLIASRVSWKWYVFFLAWLATCAAPIFQLWGLAPNLEGARFYFFLTMPLSLILPLLLFYPQDLRGDRSGKIVSIVGVAALLGLLVFYQKAAANTNMLWVHAGKEVARLSDVCQKMAAATTANERMIVLGIPQDNRGAHMILNGVTFDTMLHAPFAKEDCSRKFLNCAPVMYSPTDVINGGQFKSMLQMPDVLGAYVWSREKRDLIKLENGQTATANLPPLLLSQADRPSGVSAGLEFVFNLRNINPLDYQYLQFDIEQKGDPATAERVGSVSWTGTQIIDPDTSKQNTANFFLSSHRNYRNFQTETINLGHHWRWYSAGQIQSLRIKFPQSSGCSVRNVRLLPFAECAPMLTIASVSPLDIWPNPFMSTVHLQPVTLQLTDARKALSSSIRLELSKVNFFYDNFEEQEKVDPVDRFIVISAQSGKPQKIDLEKAFGAKPFLAHGFYQIRAVYIDGDKKPVGAPSDTVTINWQ
ncbi:MAG: hypothetical protein P4L53_27650 [Candidatus Obscuribacterales bacterium]|nr:hypothetical protein [Candidatus Obscuribacterales bacterium]